jgi:hypothetical protein
LTTLDASQNSNVSSQKKVLLGDGLRILPATSNDDEDRVADNYAMHYTARNTVIRHDISSLIPKQFNVSKQLLRSVGFPAKTTHMEPISADNLHSFVFVTASSRNHFRECLNCIDTVQRYFSGYTLYFYDLDESTLLSTIPEVRCLIL